MENEEEKKHIPLKKSILNFGRNLLLPLTRRAYFHASLYFFICINDDDNKVSPRLWKTDVVEYVVDVEFDVSGKLSTKISSSETYLLLPKTYV